MESDKKEKLIIQTDLGPSKLVDLGLEILVDLGKGRYCVRGSSLHLKNLEEQGTISIHRSTVKIVPCTQ